MVVLVSPGIAPSWVWAALTREEPPLLDMVISSNKVTGGFTPAEPISRAPRVEAMLEVLVSSILTLLTLRICPTSRIFLLGGSSGAGEDQERFTAGFLIWLAKNAVCEGASPRR